MNIRLSDEAIAYAKRRTAYRARGVGNFISEVLAADEARHEQKLIHQRERELELVTREDWDRTGNCTD
jgi:hypothetical protein